jgi:hypothetical protein
MATIRRSLPLLLIALGAAYHVTFVLMDRAERGLGRISSDTLAYYVPNQLYAWQSLREGAGLLWNPYQNCGQPFFAIGTTGLLYPGSLLFAWLDPDAALATSLTLHLCVAGLGTYLLARRLSAGSAAALCGALAFAFGRGMLTLASWSPIHLAALAWLPVVLWRAECLLRGPSLRRVALLALALTLQLLPGFPQLVFFSAQLIALRLLFALLRRELPRPSASLAATAGGLLLAVLFSAVQLFPSAELAWASVRSGALSPDEIGTGLEASSALQQLFGWPWRRSETPLVLLLAGAAFARRELRAVALFFLLVTLLYLALAFGPGSPLFDLYAQLPMGSTFRRPHRFLWCASFGLSLLAALGAEAIFRTAQARARRGWLAIGLGVAGVVFAAALLRVGLAPREPGLLSVWPLAALALSVVWLVLAWPRGLAVARASLPLLVLVSGLVAGATPYLGYRLDVDYGAEQTAFEEARALLDSQGRAVVLGRPLKSSRPFALTPKSASLYRIPTIFDFEPQTSRAWAEYLTYMRTGRHYRTLSDWYDVPLTFLLGPSLQRPLLDLTAARVIVAEQQHRRLAVLRGLRRQYRGGQVSVYQNPNALPRAFVVPRLRVLDEDRILPELGVRAGRTGAPDPRGLGRCAGLPLPGGPARAGLARDGARAGRRDPAGEPRVPSGRRARGTLGRRVPLPPHQPGPGRRRDLDERARDRPAARPPALVPARRIAGLGVRVPA